MSDISFLDLPEKRLAYALSEGTSPGVVFLGGFRSDMTGAKATALEIFCHERGRRFLRFDYTGHGQSSCDFMASSIGTWKDDVLAMLDNITPGKNILVGSSMGAWLMLLAARERHENMAGLVGIASAVDFTERCIWQQLDKAQKKEINEQGVLYIPSCYGSEPFPITRTLIEDGRRHLLLDHSIAIDAPVRLLHGTKDEDVPWQMSVELLEKLETPDATLQLVKDGNHRLSEPAQLALLCKTVEEMLASI
ncbi:MAG: alpha/beta hydrolase [Pseudomonadota bacterium]|nr:alpha/beta hydrolase [Pseudomonadota bacterium]